MVLNGEELKDLLLTIVGNFPVLPIYVVLLKTIPLVFMASEYDGS